MKKKLLLIGAILFLTGCGTNALEKNYKNMDPSTKGINGYRVNVRINSDESSKSISDIVRITNYNNTQYKIEILYSSSQEDTKEPSASEINEPKRNESEPFESERNEPEIKEPERIYIKGNKVYTADEQGLYSVNEKDIIYNNPDLYLESVKHLATIDKGTKSTIGEKEYILYQVKFEKEFMAKIIADTGLKGKKVTKDVSGEVYIDSDDNVYRITYNLGEKTSIKVFFFSINEISKIIFPDEIK